MHSPPSLEHRSGLVSPPLPRDHGDPGVQGSVWQQKVSMFKRRWYHTSENSEPTSCHKCWPLDPGTLATLSTVGGLSGHLGRYPAQPGLALTFHLDIELAQVTFQGPLYEAHVLQGPKLDGLIASSTPYPTSQRKCREKWPTSRHSCRLRPSSCRLSREARLWVLLLKARCMLEAPSRRRHWIQ